MVLTTYWIRTPFSHGPVGFGVTARSLDDAVAIIRAMDYGRFLPDDLGQLVVREAVTLADLYQLHVVPNTGPLAVRGMWYPIAALGVPAWAEERIRAGKPPTLRVGVLATDPV